MKHELIKRISKIHAIKCWKATEMNQSIESFNQLSILNEKVIGCETDDHWDAVNQEVSDWAGANPIATDREINELLNK